ncbi:MAG: Ycf51 family protein [Thainema sp.]
MPTPAEFLDFTKWSAIITLAFAALTAIAFFLQWGLRFRLVGATGFMGVLTAGLFALSVVPIMRTVIPGAVQYTTVYDSGATQVVIKVNPEISQSELEATLAQAASNLFGPGRLGLPGESPTIRARTILHPEDNVSKLVYLGEVQRSRSAQADQKYEVTLYPDGLATLAKAQSATSTS